MDIFRPEVLPQQAARYPWMRNVFPVAGQKEARARYSHLIPRANFVVSLLGDFHHFGGTGSYGQWLKSITIQSCQS